MWTTVLPCLSFSEHGFLIKNVYILGIAFLKNVLLYYWIGNEMALKVQCEGFNVIY